MNCTQSLRRVEFTNGKEAKFEEQTTILGDLNMFGADPAAAKMMLMNGSSPQVSFHITCMCNERINFQDVAITDVLMQTQDTFMSLLHQKKDQLLAMFPDLFSNLRTQPEIFQAPCTAMETIVNPDGTTTTRTKSSKAFRYAPSTKQV